MRSNTGRQSGFTLVELAVIVLVTCALGMTMTAGLGYSRPGASTYHCRNNLRQLAIAAQMYADDFKGYLPGNIMSSNAGKTRDYPSWAGGWLDFSAWADNTNTAYLVDPNHTYPYGAALGPYTKSPAIYKCPSDYSKVLIGNREYPRVRSISFNGRVGYVSRSWARPTRFWMYPTYDKIAHPSEIFFFIDEREDSVNDPVFLTNPDQQDQLVDYPASYHSGAANLSFADGHVETHNWTDQRTAPPLEPSKFLKLDVNIPGDPDVLWIQQHSAEPK